MVHFIFFQDDLTVTYPKDTSALFSAVFCLFEALMELDDDETIAFSQCTGGNAKELLQLVRSLSSN